LHSTKFAIVACGCGIILTVLELILPWISVGGPPPPRGIPSSPTIVWSIQTSTGFLGIIGLLTSIIGFYLSLHKIIKHASIISIVGGLLTIFSVYDALSKCSLMMMPEIGIFVTMIGGILVTIAAMLSIH
jgi:hypothetical protein